jgi:hypothetical protein
MDASINVQPHVVIDTDRMGNPSGTAFPFDGPANVIEPRQPVVTDDP